MNKYLYSTGIALCALLCICCTGCSTYTTYNLKNTSYDEVWQACMKVRDRYKPLDVTVKKNGSQKFETITDKEKGIIAFATEETFVRHIENTITLKQAGSDTVNISVKSIDSTIVLPWENRSEEHETELLDEILSALGYK